MDGLHSLSAYWRSQPVVTKQKDLTLLFIESREISQRKSASISRPALNDFFVCESDAALREVAILFAKFLGIERSTGCVFAYMGETSRL